MMIYLLDCDMNGLDSISAELNTGKVTRLPCPTFQAFENACVALLKVVGPEDLVICDTITSLLNTTRGDAKLGTDPEKSIWEVGQAKYLSGDKNYLTVYEMAGQLTMRRLKNLRARECRIIVTAHCSEVKDESFGNMKKLGPEVNPAMVGTLVGASSDLFRLEEIAEAITDPNTGEVRVKAGERILWLRRTDAYMAKFHVTRERSEVIPTGITNPSLPKLYGVLGKKPSWLTIYGFPGAGKTSFAVSEVSTISLAESEEKEHVA